MCPAPLPSSKNLQNVFAFTTASPRKSGPILCLDRPRVSRFAQKARNNPRALCSSVADVKKIVCVCSQSPMCVRWKVSRYCAAIDKWLKLPCVLLERNECWCAFRISLLICRKQWYLVFNNFLSSYYSKSLRSIFYNLRILSSQFHNILLYGEFSRSELSGTCVGRKLWIPRERLGREKRDCPMGKEEDDGSALSEARLCVNVWLAFGRQP